MIVQVYECLRNRAATSARVIMFWVVPRHQVEGKVRGLSHLRQGVADLRLYCLQGPCQDSRLAPISSCLDPAPDLLLIAHTCLELLLTADGGSNIRWVWRLEGQIRLGEGKERIAGQRVMMQRSPEASLEENISRRKALKAWT